MLHTYEMRWFFVEAPLDASTHFDEGFELQVRTDWYASPCSPAWGVKLREGQIETKILDQRHGPLRLGKFRGHLESYKKWSLKFPEDDRPAAADLENAQWVAVQKHRKLKRFSVDGERVTLIDIRPVNGCELEMTELMVENRHYWTVGFEAVGAASLLPDNLRRVAQQVAGQGGLWGQFDENNSFGYAQWLAEIDSN